MDVEPGRCAFRNDDFDDDGKPRRTGDWITASTHIITIVVGAGVLALAWAMAQLGWILGISVMVGMSTVSILTYSFIADCYRYPDPETGKRNYAYMQAVKAYLGGKMYIFCGTILYAKLVGINIGYTITTSTSLVAIKKSNCFHKYGHAADCKFSNNPYMAAFGLVQIFLSQIPRFHELTWLSTIACITSFGYAFIAIGLSMAVVFQGKGMPTSLTGTHVGPDLPLDEKIWKGLSALGNMALACTYATVIYDIMDTLKSSPPERKQMKKANAIGISTMTLLFMGCASFGYAAFGDKTPGNILTGFGFFEPWWLVDLGNVCIAVHIAGAYQLLAHPFFRLVETNAKRMWPNSEFIHREYPVILGCMPFSLNLFRLTWRTIYVILCMVVAMAMPFFNEFLALIGAIGFWPLVVFFPIKMHLAQTKLKAPTPKWIGLQIINFVCFLITMIATVASIRELIMNVHKYKPFLYKQ